MTEKTKILHIITNLELGGAQKNALLIIDRLDSELYQKYFISSTTGLLREETNKIKSASFYFLPFLKREISPWDDLRLMFWLIRFMRKEKIRLVHTHSSKAGILGRWAAKLSGVPIIIHTIHGWSFNDYQGSLPKNLYIFLERITARITGFFVAVSQSDIRKGLDSGIGEKNQYALIRYGIDFSGESKSLDLADRKKIIGAGENEPVVGMIACLKPQKNPLDFIKAAAIISKSVPAVKFICAGDGLLRPKMQKFIDEQGLRGKVILLGWRRDIDALLPLFDIVVLTSLWEGLPIALLEAMACSKPIVAYGVDGVKEIIRDTENGFLIKPADIAALAEKVKFLLRDKETAKRMGKKGKYFLENSAFKTEKMIEDINALYQRQINPKGQPQKSLKDF